VHISGIMQSKWLHAAISSKHSPPIAFRYKKLSQGCAHARSEFDGRGGGIRIPDPLLPKNGHGILLCLDGVVHTKQIRDFETLRTGRYKRF
jgi:hypothetical protein